MSISDVVEQALQTGSAGRGSNVYLNSRAVLIRRFGLISGYVETLQSIAEDLAITRQRVCQIEEDSTERIRRALRRGNPLGDFSQELEKTLVRYQILSGLELVEIFSGGQERHEDFDKLASMAFLCLICGCYILRLNPMRGNWILVSSSVQADKYTHVIRLAKSKVKNGGPTSVDRLLHALASELKSSKAFTERSLSLCDEISIDPEGVVLPHDPLKWHKVAYSLHKIGAPAHFSEIARELRESFPNDEYLSDHSVHAKLDIQEPRVFRRVARGTYGLAEWNESAEKARSKPLQEVSSQDFSYAVRS